MLASPNFNDSLGTGFGQIEVVLQVAFEVGMTNHVDYCKRSLSIHMMLMDEVHTRLSALFSDDTALLIRPYHCKILPLCG